MRGLRIVLDKSVVFGLSNAEVDSLDRYFFQIVPPILADEILSDLTKEAENPNVKNRIAAYSYRVSGNRGLTMDYRKVLTNSLLGNEIPMGGKFLPSGESTVRTASGSLATIVETPLEDRTIAKWERGEFTDEQRLWARRFRSRTERPLNYKLYTDIIAKVGLKFRPPETTDELIETVDSLLSQRELLPRLFIILAREFGTRFDFNNEVTKRWYKVGRPDFIDFAPYAFFCLRANFLWNLSLTNTRLFKPDKNDRKDLEYCYYLPHTKIFASKDNKHKSLIPALLTPEQTFVDGDELKQDLRNLSEGWIALSKEEQIAINAQRGDAPPENDNSLVYQLWKKHDGEINPSLHPGILDITLVDGSLPEEERVPITFRELLQSKAKELKAAERLSPKELDELKILHKGKNPTTMGVFKSTMSRERIKKLHPQVTDADLDKSGDDD